MSCFGLCFTQESSRQRRKGYNPLVKAVFPEHAPAWDAPVDAGTARKIATVQDYAAENVETCPKVSRRVYRRMQKEVGQASGAGQCKVRLQSG